MDGAAGVQPTGAHSCFTLDLVQAYSGLSARASFGGRRALKFVKHTWVDAKPTAAREDWRPTPQSGLRAGA